MPLNKCNGDNPCQIHARTKQSDSIGTICVMSLCRKVQTHSREWIHDSTQLDQGDGRFAWMNKDTYEGAWASDVMSGFGTTKYANGNVYSGEVRRLRVFASTSRLRQVCVHAYMMLAQMCWKYNKTAHAVCLRGTCVRCTCAAQGQC